MPRRTIIITALPIAILLIFSGIGVIASRSGGAGDSQASGKNSGLAFAIAEPVKAKWDRATAVAANFTQQVAAPNTNVNRQFDQTRQKIDLDDQRDVHILKSRCLGPDFGFLVNNGSKAERVLIDEFTASDCTEYGGYIDGASDWWIRNSTLSLAKDATQHGLRIARGDRIRISDTVIDTHLADKTTLWVLNGSDIELRNVKLIGGRNWFSIDPDNPDLPDGKVINIIIADCWIDCDQDWPNAMEFMPGVENVTITNLHVRGIKPPIGVWTSVGDVAGAKNVRWKDIWVPAPGQAADKPFDELDWVKLRDDDWDRIVTHKGQSRDAAKANGIGPLP